MAPMVYIREPEQPTWTFIFSGLSPDNELACGEIEAGSADEARRVLRECGFTVSWLSLAVSEL